MVHTNGTPQSLIKKQQYMNMEKDELYRVALVQCLARQCAAFAATAAQYTPDNWESEAAYIDDAMLLAAGKKQYTLLQIENRAMLPIFETVGSKGAGKWKIPAGELKLSSASFATDKEACFNHKPSLERLLTEVQHLDQAGLSAKTYAETLLTMLYK